MTKRDGEKNHDQQCDINLAVPFAATECWVTVRILCATADLFTTSCAACRISIAICCLNIHSDTAAHTARWSGVIGSRIRRTVVRRPSAARHSRRGHAAARDLQFGAE